MTEAEIITSHKGIARFLGLTPRQVSWLDDQGKLPTFRVGRTVCARKATLLHWIDEMGQGGKGGKKVNSSK